GTDNGAFISNNGGGSFVSAGLQGDFINVVYISGNYLFAYGPSGLKQSTNSGTSWIPFDPAIPYSDITEFLVSGNKVFATTSGILMSSNVNAPTWSQTVFNTPIDFNYSICKSGSEILVGSNRGVFGSTDNGVTWSAKTNGLQIQNVNGITSSGTDTVFAGASIYGVSKFNNGNWNFSGLAQLNSNHMKSRGNEVYSASDFGIHKTVDGGNTWQFVNNVGPNPVTGFCQRVEVKDTLLLGACLQSGVLRSGDNGATWTFSNNGMPTAQVSCVTVSGSNIVAGTYNEGLYTSTDAGFNWTQTGAPSYLINDVATIGNRVFAATSFGNFLSSDNGNTWSNTTFDYYEDLFAANGLVFASGPSYVHISRDSGLTFPEVVVAPIGTTISSVTASNDFLYVGTVKDGVWKRSISEILDVEDAGMSRPFALLLPNVFTEQATLVIDDRMLGSNTEFIITDLTGKTIRKSKISATSTILSADGLAPATYLYNIIKSGKMLHSGKFIISGRK
ncbi:MAG: WD40/YVTN/BNR-like repeat-containing protein, partial [Bacteroidota bacterium]